MRAWVEAVAEAELESEVCVEVVMVDEEVGEVAVYCQRLMPTWNTRLAYVKICSHIVTPAPLHTLLKFANATCSLSPHLLDR